MKVRQKPFSGSRWTTGSVFRQFSVGRLLSGSILRIEVDRKIETNGRVNVLGVFEATYTFEPEYPRARTVRWRLIASPYEREISLSYAWARAEQR